MEASTGQLFIASCYAAAMSLIRYGSQSFDESIDQEEQQFEQDSTSSQQQIFDSEDQLDQAERFISKRASSAESDRYFKPKDKDYIELPCPEDRKHFNRIPEDNKACNTNSEFDRDYFEARLYCEISEEFDRGKSFVEEERRDGLQLFRSIRSV